MFYLSLTLEPAVKLKEVVFYGSNNSQAHIINKQWIWTKLNANENLRLVS